MPRTDFIVNTAMVCHNCCRVAVVRLYQSWRVVALARDDKEVLDVVFVSCARCLTQFRIHNPMTALFSKYVDRQQYNGVLQFLVDIFKCAPSILEQGTLSTTAQGFKRLARVYDISEIFDVPKIPDCYLMILEDGKEVRQNCKFFSHDPHYTVREYVRYRGEPGSQYQRLPFSSVAHPPPISGRQQLLHEDLPPPPYIPG